MGSIRKFRAVLTLLLVLAVGSLSAAEVGKIIIEQQGGGTLEPSLENLVMLTIRTRVDREFAVEVLSDDISQILKNGNFEDVQTRLTNLPDGKLQVIYSVKPRKPVRDIAIQGNTYLKTKRLMQILSHKKNVPLNEKTLSNDRLAILDKYRDAGYYDTEVRSVTTENADGTVSVTHVITEATRVKLQGTAFVGNTVFEESELRDVMMTKRQWWRYIFRLGNYFNSRQLDLDKARLRDLYTTRGYLDFAVEDIKLVYDENHKWVTPTYYIAEGEPYTVGNITIEGTEKMDGQELLAKTRLATGDVYDSSIENQDLNLMKAKYEEQGYMSLVFNAVHNQNSENHTVDITYVVEEGTPSRIRDIHITGNHVTQNHVILREMGVLPGDLGDNGKLRLSQARLMNTGFFSSVDIYPSVTPYDDQKDIQVDVEEKSTGSVSLGAGFSSEDSVIGFLEFQERNFDVSRLFDWPPRGAGQSFRTYVAVGSESQNVSISLVEPSLFDSGFELSNDFFLNTRYENEYDERHVGASSVLTMPISFDIPGTSHTEYWQLGLGIRIDRVDISHIEKEEKSLDPMLATGDELQDYRIGQDKGGYWANYFLARLSRTTLDNYRFPNRGSRFTLESEFITAALGSYSNYARLHAGGAKYFPLVRNHVLKLGLDAYAAEHFSGDDIRIFDRYFGGGIGTIRGFKRRDVSPVNSNDNSIGGLSMLTGTAELITPVKDFMYFSVFTDVGNVWWEDDFGSDPLELNVSVGVGIQFKALPIRLDYGYPVHTEGDHLDGRGGRFHFNIMYSF